MKSVVKISTKIDLDCNYQLGSPGTCETLTPPWEVEEAFKRNKKKENADLYVHKMHAVYSYPIEVQRLKFWVGPFLYLVFNEIF